MANLPKRPLVGLGWKSYDLRWPGTANNPQALKGFDLAYGFRIVYGAQHLHSIDLVSSLGTEQIQRYELRDGFQYPCPGGAREVVVRWKATTTVHARVVIHVILVPGMTWSTTSGYEFFGARRSFDSILHDAEPQLVSAGTQLLVADVPADDYQKDEQTVWTGVGAFFSYSNRFSSDDTSPVWPSASLYFDGFLATDTTAGTYVDWSVWILAYVFHSAKTPFFATYRQLTPPVALTPPAGLLGVVNYRVILRLHEASSIPVPVPPNGFRMYVANTGLTDMLVTGLIAGKAA